MTNDLGSSSPHFRDRTTDLLFIQYTSGSTLAPRGVMVSHQNVIANGCASLDRAHIGVSWLPHFHDLGLIAYYLFPLIHGSSVVHFSSSDFIRQPAMWLEAIGRFGATATSAPNFAFEYCLRPDKIPDAVIPTFCLRTLKIIMNGSEPVRTDTMTRFLARFRPAGLCREALFASYGLAENTLAVSSGGRAHLRIENL